jgi:hypothetical protein
MRHDWTPEPWYVVEFDWPSGEPVDYLHIGVGCFVDIALVRAGGILAGGSPEEGRANAARIITCVNACAGMSDPAKEIRAMREEIAQLRAAMSGPIEYQVSPTNERNP